MGEKEGIKRFWWIYKFIYAFKKAIQYEISLGKDCHFNEEKLIEGLSNMMIRRLNTVNLDYAGNINESKIKNSLYFLYHLEKEILIKCGKNKNETFLETFKFVKLFYLIERWIDLFLYIQENASQISHAGVSKKFIKIVENLNPVFPFPFNLVLEKIKNKYKWTYGNEDFIKHSEYTVNATSKDYIEIINKSYRETFRKIVQKKLRDITDPKKKKEKRKYKEKDTKICFFDVFLRYSESLRYHVFMPTNYNSENVYYWNLNIEWLTLTISEIFEYLLIDFLPVDEILKYGFINQHQKYRIQLLSGLRI